MKKWLFAVMFVFLLSSAASAQNMYVTDKLEITFRTGPSTDKRITAMLESGQPVRMLQRGQDWSRVELPDGQTGYVITRYLTSEKPIRQAYEELKKNYDALTGDTKPLVEENQALKDELRRVSDELATTQKDLTDLNETHETLKRESADFLKLKASADKMQAQLIAQTEAAQQLSDELNRQARSRNIYWFLLGAGVLLLGYIIGYASKRQRRRPSLLSL